MDFLMVFIHENCFVEIAYFIGYIMTLFDAQSIKHKQILGFHNQIMSMKIIVPHKSNTMSCIILYHFNIFVLYIVFLRFKILDTYH